MLSAAALPAQVPRIVVLPETDFIYDWGRETRVDNRDRPDFSVRGNERRFHCLLTGSFRPNSRYNDAVAIRDLEAALITGPEFVQSSVSLMNRLEQSRDLQWALLDCKIPEAEAEEEDELAERENKALERARRAQQRRRERESDD